MGPWKLKATVKAYNRGSLSVRDLASDLLDNFPWEASAVEKPNNLGPGQAQRVAAQIVARWSL